MDGYFSRWGRPWDSVYQNKVDDAKKYLNDIRDAMVYNYLPNYFSSIGISSSNLCDVTVSVSGISNATIKINSITPKLAGNWTGKYYSGNPITVTANPAPSGYKFDGWMVTGGTADSASDLTTIVNITGNALITAKYSLTGSAQIPVNSITLNSTLTLTTGGNSTLNAVVDPSNATYKTVFWSSNNPSVATVNDNGRVTAVKSGTAIITASTTEGVSAMCAVTVNSAVTSVSLNITTLKLSAGNTKKLTANISPSNAPNKQTTWSSNNPSVATVTNDGTVTAVANGNATITVTTVDGSRTTTCSVTVKNPTVILDLAAKLQTLSPQSINNTNFSSLFSGLPLQTGNELLNGEGNLSITSDKKLKIEFLTNRTSGLEIKAGSGNINFQEDDKIYIKGTYTKIQDVGLILNTKASRDPWWEPLDDESGNNWGKYESGDFEYTFTLTQQEAADINDFGFLRVEVGGISPYDGSVTYPAGKATLILEQVKITRVE